MRFVLSLLLAFFLCFAAPSVPAMAGNMPVHTITSIAIGAAGWSNTEVLGTSQEGAVVAWSIRSDTGCTTTSFVPYLVDKSALSGTSTPAAAPPAEYRIAEKTSQTVSASATEPTFATSFAEQMPFTNGLRVWVNATGGTTCTLVLSTWWLK